ncbi:hypothetical protein D5086_021947 [Populus alba]|uniref:Uncharacterized protein n=1 Tax=Populus alba TaxID=43335 RepID=A0ACC4BE15_POPAL
MLGQRSCGAGANVSIGKDFRGILGTAQVTNSRIMSPGCAIIRSSGVFLYDRHGKSVRCCSEVNEKGPSEMFILA